VIPHWSVCCVQYRQAQGLRNTVTWCPSGNRLWITVSFQFINENFCARSGDYAETNVLQEIPQIDTGIVQKDHVMDGNCTCWAYLVNSYEIREIKDIWKRLKKQVQ